MCPLRYAWTCATTGERTYSSLSDDRVTMLDLSARQRSAVEGSAGAAILPGEYLPVLFGLQPGQFCVEVPLQRPALLHRHRSALRPHFVGVRPGLVRAALVRFAANRLDVVPDPGRRPPCVSRNAPRAHLDRAVVRGRPARRVEHWHVRRGRARRTVCTFCCRTRSARALNHRPRSKQRDSRRRPSLPSTTHPSGTRCVVPTRGQGQVARPHAPPAPPGLEGAFPSLTAVSRGVRLLYLPTGCEELS